jgi:hypothetical protein
VVSIPATMGAEFSAWLADDNHPSALAQRMEDFLARRLVADPVKLRRRALEFELGRMAELHERTLLGKGTAHAGL